MTMTSTFWAVDMEFADTSNNRSNRRVRLQSADATAAGTDAALVVAAYQAVTRAYMVGFSLSLNFVNDDPTGPPAFPPTGDVLITDQALITVNLTTIGKRASLNIPAPKDSIFAGTTGKPHNTVLGTGAVGALLALFESGASASLSDGEFASGTAPFAEGVRASAGRRFAG